MSSMSREAEDLLSLCGSTAKQSEKLRSALQMSAEDFGGALQELKAIGLVETSDSGKKLWRMFDGNISVEAGKLLHVLPVDGSAVGNTWLRSRLELDNEAYKKAKNELLDAKLVRRGRGRGGSLARIDGESEEQCHPPDTLVKREQDLYEPFAEWLRTTSFEEDGEGQIFAEVCPTGSPKGHKQKSGQWSRADVTAVTVTRYPMLPTVIVDAYVYEIKRSCDAKKLESVFEAASQQRCVHFASLVVESQDGANPETDLEETVGQCIRFGLGLYTMVRQSTGAYKVSEEIKPNRQEPDAAELNDFLEGFFEGHNKRRKEEFRRVIGRG